MDPKIGSCYEYDDEAIKIVGKDLNFYYYKHSWNEQDKIFQSRLDIFRGYSIKCDNSGYEFAVLTFKIKSLTNSIKYLERITEPLRK